MANLSGDIFGRIDKVITKIANSTKETSLEDKIQSFNQTVNEYNNYMKDILNLITNKTKNINRTDNENREKIDKMLDKYNEVYNTTREIINSGKINELPEGTIVKPTNEVSFDETAYDLAVEIKDKLSDSLTPEQKDKDYTPFVYRGKISKEDELKLNVNKYIKIAKDANIKAVDFGLSLKQYNMSHFTEDEFDDNKYIGKPENPNIIHRYYRGTIFFVNNGDERNFSIKEVLLLPDLEMMGWKNKSCGPQIKLDYYEDNVNFYIDVNSIVPFVVDWMDNEDELKLYDIEDTNFERPEIILELSGYFDDLTRENTYVENEEYVESLGLGKKIGDLLIEPPDTGFIVYRGFDFDNVENKDIEIATKSYIFHSHKIDEVFKIGARKEFEFFNFKKLITKIKQMNTEDSKNIVINDIHYHNDCIFVACNHGLFKFNLMLDDCSEISKLWSHKNVLCISNDSENHLVAFVKEYGPIIGSEYELNSNYSDIVDDGNHELQHIYGLVKEIKFDKYNNSFFFYTEHGIYEMTKDGDSYRLCYTFTSDDDISDFEYPYCRIRLVEDYVFFIENSSIIDIKILNEEEVTTNRLDLSRYIVKDNNTRVRSIYKDPQTNKLCLVYSEGTIFKVVSDLESSIPTVETLNDFYNNCKSINIFEFHNTDVLIGELNNNNWIVEVGVSTDFIINGSDHNPITIGVEESEYKEEIENMEAFVCINDTSNPDFLFFSDSIGIYGSSHSKVLDKSLESIKKDIIDILNNEEKLRKEAGIQNTNILYSIDVHAKRMKNLIDDNFKNKMDTSYFERGVFKTSSNNIFKYFNTANFMIAVNQEDTTEVYMSSSIKNDLCDYNMKQFVFPMGFKKLPDIYQLDDKFDTLFFVGSDNNLYGIGRNINHLISVNYPEDRCFSYPQKIDGKLNGTITMTLVNENTIVCKTDHNVIYVKDSHYDSLTAVDSDVSETNNYVSNRTTIKNIVDLNALKVIPYEEGFVRLRTGNLLDFIRNGEIDFTNITHQFHEILDIAEYDRTNSSILVLAQSESGVNKVYSFDIISGEVEEITGIENPKEIVESRKSVVILKDENDKLYILGSINGFYNDLHNSYLKALPIPDYNIDLTNSAFNNVFIGTNKSLIATNRGIFVAGDNDVNSDKEEVYGIGNDKFEAIDFFEKLPEELTFNRSNIKKVVFDTYCTFLLTNDGTLYVTGIDEYGEMGVKQPTYYDKNTCSKFVKTAENVSDIWCGDNRAIYQTTNVDGINEFYCAGSNEFGKIGAANLTNVYEWHRIYELSGSELIIVQDFYLFKDITFAVTISGDVYGCGRNDYGQLGTGDLSNVYQFTKIDNLNNIKFICTDKANDNILAIEYFGDIFVSGRNDYGKLGVESQPDLNNNYYIKEFTKVFKFEKAKIAEIFDECALIMGTDDTSYLLFGNISEDNSHYIGTKLSMDTPNCKPEQIVRSDHFKDDLLPGANKFKFRAYIRTTDKKMKSMTFGIKNVMGIDGEGNEYIESQIPLRIYDFEYTDHISYSGSVNRSIELTVNEILYCNDKVVKFVTTDNRIGCISIDENALLENNYGIGIGKPKLEKFDLVYPVFAYYGIAEFDPDTECVSIRDVIDGEPKKKESDLLHITKVGTIKRIFEDIEIEDEENVELGVCLKIEPVIPNMKDIDVQIDAQNLDLVMKIKVIN